ncbi:MAG: hypothetical protein BWY78_01178 [Alphaproteobacteria bacterium ADurb.Bin438]|nr:MAG: hypothetical protein BWY78_01178 [Alphaproteobacteria bacterium ADurb.Bin438]
MMKKCISIENLKYMLETLSQYGLVAVPIELTNEVISKARNATGHDEDSIKKVYSEILLIIDNKYPV